ncbi:MAG: TonB family protein [Bacteroidetes bacterium]|nr:TonB family protein [Bacteroidota bacterium]
MLIRLLPLILIVFSLSNVTAQKSITGRLIDADTQKPVSQATVIVVGTTTGTFSNHLGFFQLTIPSGASELMVSHVGYKTSKILIPEVSPFQIKIQRGIVQLKYFMLDSFVEYDEKNDSTSSVDSDFNIIERSAEYPGGWKNFYNDIGKTLKSKEVLSALPDSTVHLFFSVEANGDFKLARTAPDIKIIEEQIIQSTHLKKWKSAMQNNTPATQYFDLPIGNGVVETIYTVVEEPATPVGGFPEFYKYIGASMRYPASARVFGIEGKVLVQFIVEMDGRLTNIKITKGVGGGCDEEAIRLIENAPRWNPGHQRGQPVRQKYTLPIQFYLGTTGRRPNAKLDPEILTDFYKSLNYAIDYPLEARKKEVEGLVVALIIVSKENKIARTRLLKDIGEGCGEEVLRALNTVNEDQIRGLKRQKDTLLLPVIFGLDFVKNTPLPASNDRLQVLSPIKIVMRRLLTKATPTPRPQKGVISEVSSQVNTNKIEEGDSFEKAFKDPNRVKKLSLANKGIKEIPLKIDQLTSLTQLNLEANQIHSIPDQFTKLGKMYELIIADNRLRSLPDSFENLNSLRVLGLARNLFDSFPSPITQLSKLMELDLSGNDIKSIPSTISNLKKLRILFLQDNQISSFPKEFYELQNLDALYLQGNPLSDETKAQLKLKLPHTTIHY